MRSDLGRRTEHQSKQCQEKKGIIIPAVTENLNTTTNTHHCDGQAVGRGGGANTQHGGEPIGMGRDNEILVEAKQQEEQQQG